MNQQFLSSLRKGFSKWLIFGISIFIFLFFLLAILRVGFALTIYSFVANWVTVRLAFDYYVAELSAVIFTTLLLMFLPSILWFFISGRRKKEATIATIVGLLVMCVLIYTVGSNVYFNRVTGEPLRYYTCRDKEIIFSFTPVFDPVLGNKFEPYTRNVANSPKCQNEKATIVESPTLSPTIIPVLPSPTPIPNKTGGLVFNSDVSTVFSYYKKEKVLGGLLENAEERKMKLQPIEINSFDNNRIYLKFSICNAGDKSIKSGTAYIWYTSKSSETSINWESCCFDLKPGECVTKTESVNNSNKIQLVRPLGKLHITLNQNEIFGTIDLSEFNRQGQITIE